MDSLVSPLSPSDLESVTGGLYPIDRNMICHLVPSLCSGPFPIQIMPIPYPLQHIRA